MSKYITKQDASKVALKMIKKISDQIIEKKAKVSEIVSDIYLKTLPKDIAKIYDSYKSYFNKVSDIRCEGHGLNDSFRLNKSLPSDGSWQKCIIPSAQEAKVIKKFANEIENLENKKSNLKNSIEKTLLSLKTYNRIQKDFPEAYEHLPEKDTTVNALAIPIEDIRSQLEALKS